MAANHRRLRFIDPHHLLLKMEYDHRAGHCNICLLELAGLVGYGSNYCNIHVHSACAGYFGETTSFFGHPPPQSLKLSRSPPDRICNVCRGDCPQGSFVYRCTDCGFDLHPLCAMLPERVGNPFHQGHDLCMVKSSSPGRCWGCLHPLPKWHYVCICEMELHIACAIGQQATGADQGPVIQGGQGPAAMQGSPAVRGSYGASGSRRSIFDNRRLMIAIARVVLRSVIGDVATPLAEVLEAALLE